MKTHACVFMGSWYHKRFCFSLSEVRKKQEGRRKRKREEDSDGDGNITGSSG